MYTGGTRPTSPPQRNQGFANGLQVSVAAYDDQVQVIMAPEGAPPRVGPFPAQEGGAVGAGREQPAPVVTEPDEAGESVTTSSVTVEASPAACVRPVSRLLGIGAAKPGAGPGAGR